ncbi:MAG: hypothetical protein IJA55_02000 [Clostridia bacterium]|nr:hypothetical protein [Clostridia bacterium]
MKTFKNLLGIILIACMMLTFVACNTDNSVTDDADTTKASEVQTTSPEDASDDTETAADEGFKVIVADEDGTPVAGVAVQLCKDTCMPAVTDADGIASFNSEITAEHKVSVLTLPEGYEYTGEAEIYLEDGMSELTVTVTKVA